MMKSFGDYIEEQIKDGYIDGNGVPLKCVHCESKDLGSKDYYQDGRAFVVETEIICNSCGKVTGQWVYGNWDI
jgi:hypothetical protein